VLDHLRSRGFKDISRGRPHNASRSPQIRKIEAMLAAAGRTWAYADAIAQRMFHVDRVTFCSAEQQGKLIAALSYDQKRREPAQEPQP
jgi:phage gp16-like protein